MKFNVNLDQGFAFNYDLIAAIFRKDENPDETLAVMVSGETFLIHVPLSKLVGDLEEMEQKKPPKGKPEAVGGTGAQATSPQTESTEYFSRKQGEYLIKQLETISRQQRELSEQISYLKNVLAVKGMSAGNW
ncbi:hypothetical protein ACWWJF_15660 [Symbiopectobacterium sp. Eva_TO]